MSTNLIGQTLLNQFRVEAFIAAGGMGAVYRVWDLQRNVPLAMKVLHDDYAHDPALIKIFEGEAKALEVLSHPNIVRFYGLYQTQDLTFILQDFVDGASLKETLRKSQGEPLTFQEAYSYLWPVCAALGYAHSKEIVHCDVKPGNVLQNRSAKVFLADFGLARRTESLIATRGVSGTPAYMAPELIRGSPPTPQSDIFALGVMFYEMLTGGQRPISGKFTSWEEAYVNPTPPRKYNPNIPSEIEAIVLRCLAADPRQRYNSIEEIVADLNRVGVQYTQVQPLVEPTPSQIQTIPGSEEILPDGRAAPLEPRRIPIWLWLIFGGVGLFAIILMLTSTPATAPIPSLTSVSTPVRLPSPTIFTRPTQTPTSGNILRQPFSYEIKSCMSILLDTSGENRIDECVTRVTISPNQSMLIDFSWTAYLEAENEIEIVPDTRIHNMYLTDDLSNRYDHLQTGDDASRRVVLTNLESAAGWFLFSPLADGVSYFIFHDDDNQVRTQPILIQWP